MIANEKEYKEAVERFNKIEVRIKEICVGLKTQFGAVEKSKSKNELQKLYGFRFGLKNQIVQYLFEKYHITKSQLTNSTVFEIRQEFRNWSLTDLTALVVVDKLQNHIVEELYDPETWEVAALTSFNDRASERHQEKQSVDEEVTQEGGDA